MKPPLNTFFRATRTEAGVALVTALVLIVLLTVVIVAFFSKVTDNRSVEASRARSVKVDQIVKSSEDYIVSRFIGEIVSNTNSTKFTDGEAELYEPKSHANVVPERIIAPSPIDARFANLLRQSISDGDENASTHGTAAPSSNGRMITPSRWNTPVLLSDGGFQADGELPRWIYINKNGEITSAPSEDAIGRFAYNVYDIGGLLDVNLAGFPDSAVDGLAGRNKSSLHGVDLSLIPGVTNKESFINWRNAYSSSASGGGFDDNVIKMAKDGFVRPVPGDQRFGGRMDLIKYASSKSHPGFGVSSLPYFTTFSRALNGPSYSPPPLSPGTPTQDPERRYAIQQSDLPSYGKDDVLNPSLLKVRVKDSTALRRDGTPAKVGEPLVNKRFPLSLLSGIGRNGPVSPATADTIKKNFGLVWNSSQRFWTYTSPTGSSEANEIKTLDQVALEGRDPDFFELLQACVRVGSLGKYFGKTFRFHVSTAGIEGDLSTQDQIMAIGANLIDQYDVDSYPTIIKYSSREVVGIENLPYLSKVYFTLYEPKLTASGSGPAPKPPQSIYIQPEIWNPHQLPVVSNNPRPSHFRFVPIGGWRTKPTLEGDAAILSGSFSGSGASINFEASPHYSNTPMLLDSAPRGNATVIRAVDRVINENHDFIGIFVGSTTPRATRIWQFIGDPGMGYYLQYRDESGQWVSYSKMDHNDGPFSLMYVSQDPLNHHEYFPGHFLGKSDPRTQRFGFIQGAGTDSKIIPGNLGSFLQPGAGTTVQPDYSKTGVELYWTIDPYPGVNLTFPVEGGNGALVGQLSVNRIGSNLTSYYDPDGVNRLADGAYSSGAYGRPLDTVHGNEGRMSRPIILDRPFRSVGEMGYAFRDIPWKTLDLATENSADAALLDAFCIYEQDGPELSAGLVSLNSRQPLVWQAILSGAVKNELDSGASRLGTGEVERLSQRFLDEIREKPLMNRSEIATRLIPSIEPSDLASVPDAAIKFRREAVTRALTDVGDTRTWNIFIDLIAQTGKFRKTEAGELSPSDFIVEGEERKWIQTAIDRYTAEVLDTESEIVEE